MFFCKNQRGQISRSLYKFGASAFICKPCYVDVLGPGATSMYFVQWLRRCIWSSGYVDVLGQVATSDVLGQVATSMYLVKWLRLWTWSSGYVDELGPVATSMNLVQWLRRWTWSSGYVDELGPVATSMNLVQWLRRWTWSSGYVDVLGQVATSMNLVKWLRRCTCPSMKFFDCLFSNVCIASLMSTSSFVCSSMSAPLWGFTGEQRRTVFHRSNTIQFIMLVRSPYIWELSNLRTIHTLRSKESDF